MSRLCIIPCGAKKIWDSQPTAAGAYPAKQAYTGTLHRKCQVYASRFFDQWVILSAKHGLLLPDDEIPENYNAAFGTKETGIIQIPELISQMKNKKLDRFDEVVVLGGKKFTTIVPHVFTETDSITYPLIDCKGIGYMLQKLDLALKSSSEI